MRPPCTEEQGWDIKGRLISARPSEKDRLRALHGETPTSSLRATAKDDHLLDFAQFNKAGHILEALCNRCCILSTYLGQYREELFTGSDLQLESQHFITTQLEFSQSHFHLMSPLSTIAGSDCPPTDEELDTYEDTLHQEWEDLITLGERIDDDLTDLYSRLFKDSKDLVPPVKDVGRGELWLISEEWLEVSLWLKDEDQNTFPEV